MSFRNSLISALMSPFRKARHLVPVVLIISWSIMLRYEAIFLPHSLVDDIPIIKETILFFKVKEQEGLVSAIQKSKWLTKHYGNIGFFFFRFYSYKLTNFNPQVQHSIRLITLAAITGFIFAIGSGRLRCRIYDTPVQHGERIIRGAVALVATAIFVLADIPQWINLHALQAHWLRLHTTDPPAGLALLLHLLFLTLLCHNSSAPLTLRTVAHALLCSVFFIIAITMRPTTLAFAFPIVLLALFFSMTRDRRFISLVATIVIFLTLFLLFLLILKWMRGTFTFTPPHTYGSEFSFSLSTFRTNWEKYKSFLSSGFGPLILLTYAAFLLRAIDSFRSPFSFQRFVLSNFLSFYTGLSALIGLLIFFPWPHTLPRYLFLFLMYFVLLFSDECTSIVLGLRNNIRNKRHFYILGICFVFGFVITLLSKYSIAILCPLLALIRPFRCRLGLDRRSACILTNSYLLGCITLPVVFIIWYGLHANGTLVQNCSSIENLYSTALEKLDILVPQGERINLLFSKNDEKGVSIATYFTYLKKQNRNFAFRNSFVEIPRGEWVFMTTDKPGFNKAKEQCVPIWEGEYRKETILPAVYQDWRRSLWDMESTGTVRIKVNKAVFLGKRI